MKVSRRTFAIGVAATVLVAAVLVAALLQVPGTRATAQTLAGTWAQPAGVQYGISVERVLQLSADGTGETWEYLKFNGPGMGVPHPFRYTIAGGIVTMDYSDGKTDRLKIASLGLLGLTTEGMGRAAYVGGGTWHRTLK